jgi:PAS domain S-box-containing protein
VPEPRVRILNVNDDAATRYLVAKMLRKGGYEVVEAANGGEALRLAAERPDLVVLDVRLPDISGLEVCRRLKADPATATIPVLQTSATFTSSTRKIEGLDSGADAYLTQPIDDLELLATVRALLRARRAEDAVSRAAQRWQATFDAIGDGIVIVDARGTVVSCNRAMAGLLGLEPGGIVGRTASWSVGRLVAPATLEALLGEVRRRRREIEVGADGRWYRLSGDPLRDGSAEGQAVLVLVDITERKRLEEEHRARAEELAEAARRKDEFLAMLAHELRNPLNAISASNTLQDKVGAQDANNQRLRSVVARQTRNLARMVDDLLDVSRITRGQIQFRKNPVDLVQVVQQAVQGAAQLVGARKHPLEVSLPGAPIVLEGDDLRLEQAFSNLLANAAKYSEPGTPIALSLEAEGEGGGRAAVVRVRDGGIGIPGAMLESIFDMFVQADQPLARTLGGLGIGLTMVRTIVQSHGGTVVAESAGVGRGAEFVVRLPAPDQPESAPPPPALPPREEEPPVFNVVVVEDNDDARDLITAWLEMSGHSVQGAADGQSGLELALTMRPDVALVDIGLPGIDGYEVAKNLRAAEGGASVYLVAVTGYGRPEDKARALDAGFDAYVVKPIDKVALAKVLDPKNVAERRAGRPAGRATSGAAPARGPGGDVALGPSRGARRPSPFAGGARPLAPEVRARGGGRARAAQKRPEAAARRARRGPRGLAGVRPAPNGSRPTSAPRAPPPRRPATDTPPALRRDRAVATSRPARPPGALPRPTSAANAAARRPCRFVTEIASG